MSNVKTSSIANQPFYDEVADLSLAELESFSAAVLKGLKKSIKDLESSALSGEEFMRAADFGDLDLESRAKAISLIEDVHPEKSFRDLSSKFSIKLSEIYSSYSLNKKIYAHYEKINPENLSTEARYLYENIMLGYSLSGVDKPAEVRKRVKAIREEMSELSNKFHRNIAESTPTLEFQPEDLKGCYQDFIKRNLKPSGKVKIRAAGSDLVHVLQNCQVKSTREKVREVSLNYCKDINYDILPAYLNKSQELAGTLGFQNYAEIATADKMIENPQNIKSFLNELADSVKARVQKELSLIIEYKKKSGDNTDLSYADLDFYSAQIASELTSLDKELLEQFFPYQHVKEQILDFASQFYGIKFSKNDSAKVWHSGVEAYDVFRQDSDRLIGRIYLDMHPREGKYNHACQVGMVSGVKDISIPQGLLICNFNKPTEDSPGLQSIDDVSTFFHEFGHLMHSIIGGQQVGWSSLSGTSVQWDFVEVPSQLAEEFLISPEVLKKLSKNVKTGEPIDDKTILKLKEESDVMYTSKLKGIGVARQVALSRQSLALYTPTKKVTNESIREIEQESMMESLGVYGNYDHMYAFGHILGGYTSNYYTYMWSLAITKDLFARFKKDGVSNPATIQDYVQDIIAPGGSAPAADLIHQFLGRDWNMQAFQDYLKEGEDLLR